MKIIAEKPWSYVLFDNGVDWVVTLLIGGVIEIDISVRLNSTEKEQISKDKAYVEKLVSEIKNNRENFSSREIIPAVWPPAN